MNLPSAALRGVPRRAANIHFFEYGEACSVLLWATIQLSLPSLSAGTEVGQWFSHDFADPLMSGLKARAGFNQSDGPEPFLRAFIDGQIFPYVNSCYVLTEDGQPDCEQIAGECAEKGGGCNYVYMIESLVVVGAVWAMLLLLGFLIMSVQGCWRRCRKDALEDSRDRESADGCECCGLLAPFLLVTSLVVLCTALVGLVSVYGLLGDAEALLEGVRRGAGVAGELNHVAVEALGWTVTEANRFSRAKRGYLQELDAIGDALGEVKWAAGRMVEATGELAGLVEGCTKGTAQCGRKPKLHAAHPPRRPSGAAKAAQEQGQGQEQALGWDAALVSVGWRRRMLGEGAGRSGRPEYKLGQVGYAHGFGAAYNANAPNISNSTWNRCTFSPAAPNGTHPVGEGAVLDNGHPNPTCRDLVTGLPVACPCCRVCHHLEEQLLLGAASLPSSRDIAALNSTLPPQALPVWAQEAWGYYQEPLQSAVQAFAPLDASVSKGIDWLSSKAPVAAAVSLTLWGPSCVALCVLAAALLLPQLFQPTEDRGEDTPRSGRQRWHADRTRCWWAAFGLGLGSTAFLLAPTFGLLSVVTVPYSDLCAIMPRKGFDVGPFLGLIEGSIDPVDQDDHLPTLLLQSCLLDPTGTVWEVMKTSREDFRQKLHADNASTVLPPAAVDKALGTARYKQLAQINIEVFDITALDPSFAVTQCPPNAFAGCAADMEAYRTELEEQLEELRNVSAALLTSLQKLKDLSDEQRPAVRSLLAAADASTHAMQEHLWDAGGCEYLHETYVQVRTPLCDGLARDLEAAWGACFLGAVAWIPVLIGICAAARGRGGDKGGYRLVLDLQDDADDDEEEYRGMDQWERRNRMGAGQGIEEEDIEDKLEWKRSRGGRTGGGGRA